jgi:hypothetical protein
MGARHAEAIQHLKSEQRKRARLEEERVRSQGAAQQTKAVRQKSPAKCPAKEP